MNNVWSSSGSTSWNTAGNWSLGHVPTSIEDIVFDATSVVDCVIDATINVRDLSITSGYSGSFDNSVNNHNVTVNGNFENSCSTAEATKFGSGTWTFYGDFLSYSDSVYGGGTIQMAGGTTHSFKVYTRDYFDMVWNVPNGETIDFHTSQSEIHFYNSVNFDGHFQRSGPFAIRFSLYGAGKTHTIGPNFSMVLGTIHSGYGFYMLGANATLINNGDMRGWGTVVPGGGSITVQGTSSSWFPNLNCVGYLQPCWLKGTIKIDGYLNQTGWIGIDNSLYNPDIEVHNGNIDIQNTGKRPYVKGTGTVKMISASAQTIRNDYAMDAIEFEGGGTFTQSTSALTVESFKLSNGLYNTAGLNLTTVNNFTINPGSSWVGSGLNGSVITVGGNMLAAGASGTHIDWNATANWTLAVTGSANALYVDVAYSQATVTGVTGSSCIDNGNNTGWTFGGIVTRTWSSAGSTSWNTPANWSGGAVPSITENVLFDATSVVNCTFDVNAVCNNLTVQSTYTGAINASTFDMDVTSDITIGAVSGTPAHTGQINLGSGTWTLGGNLYLGACSNIVGGTSTVVMTGTAALRTRADTAGTLALNNLTISSGITVTHDVHDNTTSVLTKGILLVNGTLSLTDTIEPWTSSTVQIGGSGKITGAGKLAPWNGISQNNGLIDVATCEIHGQAAGTHTIGGAGTFNSATMQIGSTRAANNITYQFTGSPVFATAVTFYKGSAGSLAVDNSVNNPYLNFQNTVNSAGVGGLTWTKGTGAITLNTNSFSFGLQSTGSLDDVLINNSGNTITLTQNLNCQNLAHQAGSIDPNGSNITTSGYFNISPNAQIVPTNMGGTTWTVGTNIDWDGASGNLTNLQVPSTWYLNVAGTSDVKYCDVSNSDASGSALIINANYLSNVDSGGNINWKFFDDYRFWTGAGDGLWSNPANWSSSDGGVSGASVPDATKEVYFNGSGNVNCTVDTNINVVLIDISHNTTDYTQTINWGNYNVTVSNYFWCGFAHNNKHDGYFTCTGGIWNVGGDFRFFAQSDRVTGLVNATLNCSGTSNEFWMAMSIYSQMVFGYCNFLNGSDYTLYSDTLGRGNLPIASNLIIGGTIRSVADYGNCTIRVSTTLQIQSTANIQGVPNPTYGLVFYLDNNGSVTQFDPAATVNVQGWSYNGLVGTYVGNFVAGNYGPRFYINSGEIRFGAGTFTFDVLEIYVKSYEDISFDCATNSPAINLKDDLIINRPQSGLVEWKAGGTLNINGTADQSIAADLDSGAFSNTIINNPGNTVTLTSGAGPFTSLTINGGNFDSAGFDVISSGTVNMNSGGDTLTMGSGTWTLGGSLLETAGTIDSSGIPSIVMTGTGTILAGRTWNNFEVQGINSIAGGGNMTVQGNLTVDGGATWTKGAGTITLSGAGSGTQTVDTNNKSIESITVNDAGATKQLVSALNTENLIITIGVWDLNDQNINCSGNLSVAAGATWTKGTGTLTFSGAGAGTQTIDTAAKVVEDVVINDAGAAKQLLSNLNTDSFTVSAGGFDANDFNVTPSVGDIVLTGGGTILMGSGIWSCIANWDSSGTTPTRETSTVIFSGSTSHIFKTASAPNFHNVTVPVGETVSFDQSGQFTVWGALVINSPITSTVSKILALAGTGPQTMSIGAAGSVASSFSRLDAIGALTIAAGGTVSCILHTESAVSNWVIDDAANLQDIDIGNGGTLTISNNTISCKSMVVGSCTIANNTNNPSFIVEEAFQSGANWTKGSGSITIGGSGIGVHLINTAAEVEAMTLNDAGATHYIQAASTLKVAAFNAIAGTFDTGNNNIECSGNFVIEPAVILNTGTGTITLLGSGDVNLDTHGKTIEDVITQKASGVTLLSDLVAHSLTVTTGDFDANDFNVTTTVGDVQMNSVGVMDMGSGTWTCIGSFTISAGTVNEETSLLMLTGVAKNLTGGRSYYKLDVSGTYTVNGALTLLDLDVSGELAHANFGFNVSGNLTVDGGATWTKGTGTITLSGAGSGTQTVDANDKSLEDMVINDAGAIKQLLSTLRVESLTLTNGELDTNNMNIYITVGDLTVAAAATYTRGIINSRVRFVGTGAQGLTVDTADIIDVIHVEKPSGAFTFNTNANIEAFFANQGDININGKTITTLASFFVDTLADFAPVTGLNGCTINVGGNVTFVGSSGNILDMRATVEWYLNVIGSSMASYVNVSWSDASGGQQILANDFTSIDSGNNKKWIFPGVVTAGAGGRPIPSLLAIIKREFGFPR